MRSIRRALAVAILLCVGCPQRFDPRAQPNLSSPNADADRTFRDARTKFEAGQHEAARAEFEKFAQQFPDDPLKPFAKIFSGRASYEKGDYKAARQALDPVASGPPDQAATEQARFYLGLVHAREGHCAKGREMLDPIAERLAPGDDAMEMHAALAACFEKIADASNALSHWSGYWEIGRDAERAFAVRKAQMLADSIPGDRSLALYATAKGGSLARAVLGPKAAVAARAQADAGRADEILHESERLREKYGLAGKKEEPPSSYARTDARLIGVVLPLSGQYKMQGQRALRGAAMAVEALSNGQLSLAVRDTGGDKARAQQAVDELAGEEGVIAIVGPLDKTDAEVAASRAQQLGVPLIDLTVAPAPSAGPYVFHAVHDPAARVRALIVRAKAQGGTGAAVLYPDNAYGRRMRDLFVQEAQRANLPVAGQAAYESNATAFGQPIKELRLRKWDVLFVPDLASRLELIAPALAAADLWPTLPGAVKQPKVRNITLVSTAEDLSARVLKESRYLQGALLAPGYYPEEDSFVQQYRGEHGDDPKLFEAFAYDAVHAVRAALESGAHDRAQLAARLGALGGVYGVTGKLKFTPGGDRADTAAVYTIQGEAIHRAQ
jgi:ABC-type branched-subunit amino acid transport system substrate-binding protein